MIEKEPIYGIFDSYPETSRPSITTLQDVWKETGTDLSHLIYAAAPLELHAFQPSPDVTEYLAVIKFPLNYNNFMNTLSRTAPANSRSIADVIADWKEKNEELMSAHSGALGEAWSKFIPHLNTFARTLDIHNTHILLTQESMKQFVVDRSQLIWTYLLYDQQNHSDLTSVSHQFVRFLMTKYKFQPNINLYGQFYNPETFYSADLHKKPLSDPQSIERKAHHDIQTFIKGLSEPEISELYTLYVRSSEITNGKTDITISRDGAPISAEFNSLQVKNYSRRSIRVNIDDLGTNTYILRNGFERLLLAPESNYEHWQAVNNAEQAYVNHLYPVIHWYSDGTDRYIDVSPFSDLPYPSRKILSKEITTVMNVTGVRFSGNRMNTLLGLLTAAYYHPDMRKNISLWPKEVGFQKHAKKKQQMMEAQLPVLAIMQEQEISKNNPLLTALEQFVQSSE